MKVSASLWSADQLDLGGAVELLDGHVDGFHMDVMDGHFVPQLGFGVDVVRAVSARARSSPVDVHLMVTDADAWIEPFAEAGADMLTVHPQSCRDAAATLSSIEARGVQPGVALTLDLPVESVGPLLDRVRRVLVMGTPIGIKGVDLSPEAGPRIRRLVQLRGRERPPSGDLRGRGDPAADGAGAGRRRCRRGRAGLAGVRGAGLAGGRAVHDTFPPAAGRQA